MQLVQDDSALNEKFRFLRYDANQRFSPHFDGGFKRGARCCATSVVLSMLMLIYSEQTHFTFIIYLNDDFDGGETTFFPGGQTGFRTKEQREEVRVRPKTGMAVVFRHTGSSPHSLALPSPPFLDVFCSQRCRPKKPAARRISALYADHPQVRPQD